MAKKIKISKDWRNVLIFMAIFFLIVLIIYFTLNLNSKIDWEMLDNYDDSLTSCSLQANSLMLNEKYEFAESQLIICKSIVNEALVKINGWGREDFSDEIKVAKIDYQTSSDFIDAVDLLLAVKLGNFDTPKNALDKLKQAKNLIDNSLSNINTIESIYSGTKYYKRYYQPKKEDIERSKKSIQDLKIQIQQTLDYYNNLKCNSGYVLGEDYQCYPQCGDTTHYCTSGACCNNKCLSCPPGSYLATDCKCY